MSLPISPVSSSLDVAEGKTYREHIELIANRFPDAAAFQTIHTFFREAKAKPPRPTQVSVIDCVDGRHKMHELVKSAGQLRSLLPANGEAISTRMVIVEYEAEVPFDADIIDLLGSCYDIDPYLLHCHLDLTDDTNYTERPSLQHNAVVVEQQAFDGEGRQYKFNGMVLRRAEHPVLHDLCPSIGLPDPTPPI